MATSKSHLFRKTPIFKHIVIERKLSLNDLPKGSLIKQCSFKLTPKKKTHTHCNVEITMTLAWNRSFLSRYSSYCFTNSKIKRIMLLSILMKINYLKFSDNKTLARAKKDKNFFVKMFSHAKQASDSVSGNNLVFF